MAEFRFNPFTATFDIVSDEAADVAALQAEIAIPNGRVVYGDDASTGLDHRAEFTLNDAVPAESLLTIGPASAGGLPNLPLGGATFGHKDTYASFSFAMFQGATGPTYFNGNALSGVAITTAFNTGDPEVVHKPNLSTFSKGHVIEMQGGTSGKVAFAVQNTTDTYAFIYPTFAPSNDNVMVFNSIGVATFQKLTNLNLNLGLTASKPVLTDASGDLVSNGGSLGLREFMYWDTSSNRFVSTSDMVYSALNRDFRINGPETSKGALTVKATAAHKYPIVAEIDTTQATNSDFFICNDRSQTIARIDKNGYYYSDKNQTSTAETPAYTFQKDSDTGMFSDTANTLQFTAGSSELLRLKSNYSKTIKNVAVSAVAKTASFNIVNDTFTECDTTAGAIVATLPDITTVVNGTTYIVLKSDASANTLTLKGFGTDPINGVNTKVLSAQYDTVTVIARGTNWWII